MQRGAVSYAKVRAITRVATPETEQKLLDVALAGTASHVERIVRAWRRTDRVIAAQQADARHLSRHLTTWIDDDGMVVLRGRLTPEIGAVVHPGAGRGGRPAVSRGQGGAGSRAAWWRRCPGGSGGPTRWGGWPRWRSRPTWTPARPATATRWCCTSMPRRPPRGATSRSTAPWKWTIRRSTFPRKRRGAWPAMPRWSGCTTTPTATCSTSAARRGRFRRRFAAP